MNIMASHSGQYKFKANQSKMKEVLQLGPFDGQVKEEGDIENYEIKIETHELEEHLESESVVTSDKGLVLKEEMLEDVGPYKIKVETHDLEEELGSESVVTSDKGLVLKEEMLEDVGSYKRSFELSSSKVSDPIRVCITGAAGQIGYSLIYMVGSGAVFGTDTPIILHLLDIPPMMGVLNGVCMEITDCALPCVRDVIATDDPLIAFKDIDAAFLVGSMPRKEGMERKDLLAANVKIFKVQGQAMDQHAKKSVKVLVVGNPANTNALICSKYAPSVPKENFTAMTPLDQNRAQVDLDKIDYHHFLPLFFDGLRETTHPYDFFSRAGITDLLSRGGDRILSVIPQLILPLKSALNTRDPPVICTVLQVIQELVMSSPHVGEALVPYYRQLLPTLNLFKNRNSNLGDEIDYSQRRQESLGDLIQETLELLERKGGRDAYVNIKYMVPTYQSCLIN